MDILGDSDVRPASPRSKQQGFDKNGGVVAYNSEYNSSSDDDELNVDENPFKTPEVAERWMAVYEKAKYECRHVFDPALTWSEEDEKKIIRKLDWHVCTWAVRQTTPPPIRREAHLPSTALTSPVTTLNAYTLY